MIGQSLKDLSDKRQRLFEMETKHMTLAELREYKALTRGCQHDGIMASVWLMAITTVLYAVMFILCLLIGISIWYFMGVFMLFIGFALACVIMSVAYDKARRSRELMDDRYIAFERETNDLEREQ